MALIEISEPGANCPVAVAGEDDELGAVAAVLGAVAAVLGAVAAVLGAVALAELWADAVVGPDELGCGMAGRFAEVPAVAWVLAVAGALARTGPGAWDMLPPQPCVWQLGVRAVAGWPDQAKTRPIVKTAIPAMAIIPVNLAAPDQGRVTAARNLWCGAAGVGRCRPLVPLRRFLAAATGSEAAVSGGRGGAGTPSDLPPSWTCAGEAGPSAPT